MSMMNIHMKVVPITWMDGIVFNVQDNGKIINKREY